MGPDWSKPCKERGNKLIHFVVNIVQSRKSTERTSAAVIRSRKISVCLVLRYYPQFRMFCSGRKGGGKGESNSSSSTDPSEINFETSSSRYETQTMDCQDVKVNCNKLSSKRLYWLIQGVRTERNSRIWHQGSGNALNYASKGIGNVSLPEHYQPEQYLKVRHKTAKAIFIRLANGFRPHSSAWVPFLYFLLAHFYRIAPSFSRSAFFQRRTMQSQHQWQIYFNKFSLYTH